MSDKEKLDNLEKVIDMLLLIITCLTGFLVGMLVINGFVLTSGLLLVGYMIAVLYTLFYINFKL